MNKYLEALGKPFEASSVKWRIQYTTGDKTKGFAVPYADSRAIADRLDKVVGQLHWQDTYTMWHNTVEGNKTTASQLCTISIYCEDLQQWISKTDGASNSDIEPVKGGISDAFKRAACKWNIGRYLYQFDGKWVEIEQMGKSYKIKDSEKTKLNDYYNQTVKRLFGTNPAPATVTSPTNTTKPTPLSAPTPPTAPKSEPQNTAGTIYEVSGIKVQKGVKGENTVLNLLNNSKNVVAYIQGTTNDIKAGSKLRIVDMETKEGKFGPYNIIEKYELAA